MPLDLEALVRDVVRAELTAAEVRQRATFAEVVRDALAAQTRRPVPLREIIGGTAARCRAVEARDPGLRGLAIPVGAGGRRLYIAEDVLAYLRERARAPRLRAVAGGAR